MESGQLTYVDHVTARRPLGSGAIGKRSNSAAAYQLLWRVSSGPFSKSYKNEAQADGWHAELLSALCNREQFDTETACPRRRCRRSWAGWDTTRLSGGVSYNFRKGE